MFSDYLKLGIDHILDPNGYDHILFVTVLCALYKPDQWKKLIILVTAFTLGHSLTLALSSLDILSINPMFVEILIPITIIITGIYNIINVRMQTNGGSQLKWNYLLALAFGLIHGLGFSNYFKAILGRDNDIISPLFAFNLGVESGQILIVGIIMALSFFFINIMKLNKKIWTTTVSVIGILLAGTLLIEKL